MLPFYRSSNPIQEVRNTSQKVDMVFIAHDTEAQVVPEQDFFALSQGGARAVRPPISWR